jgi:hypothetical protein
MEGQYRRALFNAVGFTGSIGAGKTMSALIAAERLTKLTGYTWKVISFATELKRLTSIIFNFPYCFTLTQACKDIVMPISEGPLIPITSEMLKINLEDDKISIINKKIMQEASPQMNIRDLLVLVGSAFRDVDPGYWIKVLEASLYADDCVVIDDVRFENEAAWIRYCRVGIICHVGEEDEKPSLGYDVQMKRGEEKVLFDYFKQWSDCI